MTKPDRTILEKYSLIPPLLKKYRQANKRIVLTQGTFDMIHVGHARYLAQAKTHGDVLFVAVDSDEKVRLRKGPERPVVPQTERMEMLTYFTSVDHVVLKPLKAQKWELIKLIKPDVLIATRSTYTPDQITELKQYCAQVVVLDPQATTSTSAKLRRLQIGFAQSFSQLLGPRIEKAINQTIKELEK